MIRGLALVVRRSLRQHAASTAITALSTALGAGLVMAVLVLADQTERQFAGGDVGYDAVLGARGSQLQLVLNSVYHLETSPGNLPWRVYEDVRADPRVEAAVPYAVGDSYRGFRVVGTTPQRFDALAPLPLARGRVFDPGRREAVVGALVARETGLDVGATFQPAHGVVGEGEHAEHEEEYVVVGVLEATGTPDDRVVWIPLEGVFRLGGHVLRGADETYVPQQGEAIPDEHKEVSAVLLKLKGGARTGQLLDRAYNLEGDEATLAWPIGRSMAELFSKLGWVSRVLELVAWLVVAVAAGSIVASLSVAMRERRREFAILRALGARRWVVSAAVVGEAGAIALLGAVLGWGVYLAIHAAAAAVVRAQTGVVLDPELAHPALLVTPAAVAVVGALAGVLPALSAYRTDVASNLSPTT